MSDQKRAKRSPVFSFVIESVPLSNNLSPFKWPKTPHRCKKCFELGVLCSSCKQQSKTPNPKKNDMSNKQNDKDKSCEDTKCNKNTFNTQSLLCSFTMKRRSFTKRDDNLSIDMDNNKISNNCQSSKLFKKRYLINKRLGKGIQGVVLSAFDTKSNMKKVAIKLFDVNASEKSIQKREIDVLTDLKGAENNEGFPKLYDHCTKKSGTYFVTDLLGESLLGVQRKFNCSKGVRIKHVLMIGQQLIRRLKLLHSLNYVHGDIKPANLMFGRGKHKNTLYLIDFGLTRHQSKLSSLIRYNYPEEIYDKDKMFLKGNPLYGSMNQHLGWNKVFKKDDVESFLYLLVNIFKGSLPWSCIPAEEANYYEIYQSKKSVDAAELCSGMPKAIQLIFEYIKTLDNYDPINYDMIENNLIEAANECKIKLESPNSHRFHWILESRRETDANKAKLNMNLRYIHSVDSIRNMSVSIESIKEKENENNDKESKKDASHIKKLRKGKGKKKGERLTMSQIK